MKLFEFIDMHSGGRAKSEAEVWYVRACTEQDARERFTAHTGLDPDHVTCPCCGSDFSVREGDDDGELAWYWGRPGDPGVEEVP